MNPPTAGKLQQTQPTGPKVLMRMLARQLLQGLLLRFSQFNGTFHGQAGGQDEIASQTRHSEIRLLDTLNGRANQCSADIGIFYSTTRPMRGSRRSRNRRIKQIAVRIVLSSIGAKNL